MEYVDENKKIIEDSYNDYISTEYKYKEVMAEQISRTAKGFIKNRDGKLEDWLRVFANEDIVISKLKQL